jgi:hypothetical protein
LVNARREQGWRAFSCNRPQNRPKKARRACEAAEHETKPQEAALIKLFCGRSPVLNAAHKGAYANK